MENGLFCEIVLGTATGRENGKLTVFGQLASIVLHSFHVLRIKIELHLHLLLRMACEDESLRPSDEETIIKCHCQVLGF